MGSVERDDEWEYVAPQYVDFTTNPLEDADNPDDWFDAPSAVGIEEEYLEEDEDYNVCNGIDVIEDADQVIEKTATPTTETRRLTRSFASTPVNEKGLPEASDTKKTPARQNTPARSTPRRTPARSKVATSPELSASDSTETKDGPAVTTNICTDLTEWRTKSKKEPPKTAKNNTKSQPARVKKPPTNGPDSEKSVQSQEQRGRSTSLKRSNSFRRSAETTNLSSSLDGKSHTSLKRTNSMRRSTSQKLNNNVSGSSLDTGNNLKRNHSRGLSAGRATSSDRQTRQRLNSNSSDTKEDNSAPASKMPKLTIPNTPTFMKRKPGPKTNADQYKKAEERELETIAMMRQELAKKRKLAQESYKKAMTGSVCQPVHAHKLPTMPQGFQFQTDSRIKSHGMETRSESRERDFMETLRSSTATKTSPQQVANQKGPTIPKPFKLTDCRKHKMGSMEDLSKADTFQSMAEKVKAFHRQTPERFKSRGRIVSANRGEGVRGRSRSPNKILTVPKTPQFETRGRTRSHHIPTHQEREEEEVQEMVKNQFKAHPVNERILTNPNTGVRKVPSKPLTTPEEFHLTAADRRAQDSSTEEEKFEFHAKPLPKKILEGPVGIKPAKQVAPTVPKSPAFALKNRVRMPAEMDEFKNESQVKVTANPVPHAGVPFQPKLGHRCTVPEPFTFEERDQVVRAKKEEKIKEIFEEEKRAREFQAQNCPSPTSDTLPHKQPKPVTQPQPFNFDIDTRGAKRAEEWSRKIEEELRQQRQQSTFKATSSDVLIKKPFVPAKSLKPLTDVNDFELYTDKRSKSREVYEQRRKAHEAEAESLKRQREKHQEEQEKLAIAKLRAEMVPKSQPVKRFKAVEVLPSERQPTVPLSPKFSTDNRMRSNVRV